MTTEPNIEALARQLARNYVEDWATGDRWFGYPSNEKEEQEAEDDYMPRARETARQYARLLGVYDGED